jgi:hypothetical protein
MIDQQFQMIVARTAEYVDQQNRRVAELEAFIKVLLPSWPDGEHYPTEISMIEMTGRENKELKKALRWAIGEGASFNPASKSFYDAGCGCCSGNIEPPEDIKQMLIGLMERKT